MPGRLAAVKFGKKTRCENHRQIALSARATFLWGGTAQATRPCRLPLFHGDVVVWGGAPRLTFHDVHPLGEGRHRLTGNIRYNLTSRWAS
jgi:alkylated DNA repair protein (DNA oxidative demethylase)